MSASVSSHQRRGVEDRREASPRKELLRQAEGLGEAGEFVQLSEDAVDKLGAKDSAPARELHEG
eukprot:6184380-Pleurochrysis_carterae.AAC.2